MIAKISRGWGAGGLLRYLMGPAGSTSTPTSGSSPAGTGRRSCTSRRGTGRRAGSTSADSPRTSPLPAEAAGVRAPAPVGRADPAPRPGLALLAAQRRRRPGAHRRGVGRGRRGPDGPHRHRPPRRPRRLPLGGDPARRRPHPHRRDAGPPGQRPPRAPAQRLLPRRGGVPRRRAPLRAHLDRPADRTAAPACTRAETEKAARRGAEETSREWLRRAARTAAVQATDPESFFRRLADLGVKVRPREMPPGHLVGYAVAAPGDVNADGQPVWFGGRRLASDLSLPALLARWRSAPPAPDPIPPLPQEHSRVGQAERAAAVQQATAAARDATGALHADPQDGPAVAHATADLLTALSAVTRRSPTPVPWAVSDDVRPRRPHTDAAPTAAVAAGGPRTPPRRVAARGGTVGEPRPRRRQRHGRADGGGGRTGRRDRRVPRGAAVSRPSRGRATHRPCAAPPVDRWRPPGSRAGPNTTDPRRASTSGHRRRGGRGRGHPGGGAGPRGGPGTGRRP